MLNITLDLDTGLAKLASTTPIKVGAPVRVTIETVRGAASASPGASPVFELGLGTDTAPSDLSAYLDEFTPENDHTFTGVLNANDTRLVRFMAGKGQVNFGCELAWTVAGQLEVAPTFLVPVQPRIIPSNPTSEGGPTYLTEAQSDARYLTQAQSDARYLVMGVPNDPTLPIYIGPNARLMSVAGGFKIQVSVDGADWQDASPIVAN